MTTWWRKLYVPVADDGAVGTLLVFSLRVWHDHFSLVEGHWWRVKAEKQMESNIIICQVMPGI
jgi:hypothetical protein